MAISVIVSNFNGARFLPKLIESLQAQQNVELEIIVVDRESKDDSLAILQQHPGIKVVSEPPLSGLVSGYARGVREASHEHLFFSNEDMWFDPGCLASLEKQIDLSARVAAADPWQWSYDGKRWIHGVTRFQKSTYDLNGVHPFRKINFVIDGPDGTEIPFACAGAFLIHRQVYDEIGGWDCSFFLDSEDIDLFIRAWQRNWKCVSVPPAKVFHAVGMSNANETGVPTSTKVGRRRYVSNRLGKGVIIWKYFSTSHLWMAFGVFAMAFANNLVKLRFEMASWDLFVLKTFLNRLASLQNFRRDHGKANRSHPGERFFTRSEAQL